MAADSDRVQQITNDLQASYESLQSSSSNISGLLSMGVATCDEIKAYNLWALATYNAQRGMLATLRANGETVPELPPYPTLYAWNDVQGEDALNIDCTGQASSLSGAMGRALQGPDAGTVYLGLDRIRIVTTEQYNYNPQASPDFAQLLAQQQQAGQLGLAPLAILIIVAGLTLTIAYGISALLSYLEQSKLEEDQVKLVKEQANAFATYTAARLQCYNACRSGGKSDNDCVAMCTKLVDKPNIKTPCLGPDCKTEWGILQWVGFTVVAGVAVMIGYKLWDRHRHGESLFPDFELPEAHNLPTSY